MILKISLLVLILFSACGSEQKAIQTGQSMTLDLQYPEAFMTLSDSGNKKFEDAVTFYQFTFSGNFPQKMTEPLDRKEYRTYVFNDIPLDEHLTIHVEALDSGKNRVCHGEQVIRYASETAHILIPLSCP